MKMVTIYLKHPLFSLKGAHDPMPNGVVVLEGKLLEEPRSGVHIQAERYFSVEKAPMSTDEELKEKEGPAMQLYLPSSKIDHIRFQENSE